jgi:hypothetical protein
MKYPVHKARRKNEPDISKPALTGKQGSFYGLIVSFVKISEKTHPGEIRWQMNQQRWI